MPYMRNKRTGEIVEVDASGRPVSQGGPPRDPTFDLQAPKAQADIDSTSTSTAKTAAEIPNVQLTGAKIQRDLRQTPISEDDAKRIDAMRQSLGDMSNTLQILGQAPAVIDRFRPGPNRSAVLKSSTPEPDDGIFSAMGAGFNKFITGTSDQDISDYKEMLRLQNVGVLAEQQAQKGPQTESDAIRMAMAGLSTDKPAELNSRIVADNLLSGMLRQQRPDFYTKWANRNGSLGALENGKSVDQAWNEFTSQRQRQYQNDPRIRGLNTGNRDVPRVQSRPPGPETGTYQQELQNYRRDVADLPLRARQIGEQQFNSDPRIAALMRAQGKASTADAPRKQNRLRYNPATGALE